MLRFCLVLRLARGVHLRRTMKTADKLGPAERAVYDLIRGKTLETPALKALYGRQVRALASAGLVKLSSESGQFELTKPAEEAPAAEVMGTLTVRVPQEMLDTLDEMGPTRSDAARLILQKGFEAVRRGSQIRRAHVSP